MSDPDSGHKHDPRIQVVTKDLIKALSQMYEKPSASNKVFPMKRLFNMKMGEGGSVVEHLNKFNTVTCQLSSVGINSQGLGVVLFARDLK